MSVYAEGKRVADQMPTPGVGCDVGQSNEDGMGELESMLNLLHRDHVREQDEEVLAVVRQLGGSTSGYLKERRSAVLKLVSEIYSPPRVTAAAKLLPELRCVPGFALDLTTMNEQGQPWDFDIAANREKAREMVLTQKPMLLIGSPMCTAFSAWQHINKLKRDPSVVSREFVRAMVHIRFCMELYKLQMDEGRYFLHEHPASATSWAQPEVRKIEQLVGVRVAVGDQCQYEAADKAGDPIKKPTKFMTNSTHIADSLSRRCSGKLGWCSRPQGGRHALCNGERAKLAAIYPFALCKAILVGFRNQMVADGRLKPGSMGLNCVMLDGGDPAAVEEHFVLC